ncbi:MAG: GTP-binding protein [Leptospira sp.]|nr:GTP-binding protein [Leptospira sp.]
MKTINLGIFAHIDAGKTTLTEKILHLAQIIPSPGSIEEGTTESDTLRIEIERGISIVSSLLQFSCSKVIPDLNLNILDTPGHLDFRSQVESVLGCIDIAVVLIDASRGVESQTELLHEELVARGIPEIFFLNKLDRSFDFYAESLASIEELLNKTPAILFHEEDYSYIWKNQEKFSERQHMELFDWSDELSAAYLENPEDLHSISLLGMKQGIVNGKVLPVLGGSAYFGQGVLEMLELIAMLDAKPPTSAPESDILVVKRCIHSEIGRLTIAKANCDIEIGKEYNVKGNGITVNNIYHVLGERLAEMKSISRGDLFASRSLNECEIAVSVEDAQFVMVVEPYSSEDRKELLTALEDLTWEDPALQLKINEDLGNIQLWGQGELHLDVSRHRLDEIFKKKYSIGEFSIARYELFKRMVKKLAFEHTAFDEKLSSGKLVANLRDTANFSKHIAFEVSLPEKIHNAIETGFYEALSRGNFHLEVMGVEMTVESYEPPDSYFDGTPSLLKVAVVSGLRNAFADQTTLIGPISDLEIVVNDEDVGNVLSLLQKREAKIQDIRKRFSGKSLIIVQASTEKMLGFSGALRNMTRGTGISYQRNSFNPENYIVLK